jgi:hypothetical protein
LKHFYNLKGIRRGQLTEKDMHGLLLQPRRLFKVQGYGPGCSGKVDGDCEEFREICGTQ